MEKDREIANLHEMKRSEGRKLAQVLRQRNVTTVLLPDNTRVDLNNINESATPFEGELYDAIKKAADDLHNRERTMFNNLIAREARQIEFQERALRQTCLPLLEEKLVRESDSNMKSVVEGFRKKHEEDTQRKKGLLPNRAAKDEYMRNLNRARKENLKNE